QIIEVTDKRALKVVARGLVKNADDKVRIRRGSVVYLHQNGDYWEVINKPTVQAALVALRPQDGAIQALVGGFHFQDGNFNRVTQAWRQPGSAFKPFIYAASLEKGLTPATQISDEPFVLTAQQTGSKPWTPKNYGNTYEPMLTMRQGLYKSRNMVSIRIMQAVGPKYVQDYLVRFGFDRERQPPVLPLALGAGSVRSEPFVLTAQQPGSKPWTPKNYGNTYEPMLTMRQGLYKSRNMVSIRIMQAVGPKYVQDYLVRFGFDRERQPPVLPLALGAGSVTPLQLASAYAVFANGGYRVPPYIIDRVTDSTGKV